VDEEGNTRYESVAVDKVKEYGGKKVQALFAANGAMRPPCSLQEFFKERVRVSDDLQMLPAGTHVFPFQYQLPAGLPGVIDFKKKRKVHLRQVALHYRLP
jgi:hypothetical protein